MNKQTKKFGLIKSVNNDGILIEIYRHKIIAGGQFLYNKGAIKTMKTKIVGYYDYIITSTPELGTISEKKLPNVFY